VENLVKEGIGMSSRDIFRADLDYIVSSLPEEMSALSGKNLLVTGGAGFLGYSIVQTVVHWNRSVPVSRSIRLTVCDNFIRGLPDWLDGLRGEQSLKIIKHDITRPLPAEAEHFPYIIHAASIASPMFYRKHPIETMDANVNGLRNLLDRWIVGNGFGSPTEGFLFFSSSEVYGDPDPEHIPTPETYNGNVSFTGPRACYDESKRYGETLCVNFAQVHGLPVKIARPFNNYGPGLKITDRRVIPDFARDILENRDIVMFSDGSPTRTFCYVSDAIIGYFKILVKGKAGAAYNIGVEGPEISVTDLAEMMVSISRELFGYQGRVHRQVSNDRQYLTDNPNRRRPDISKARRELGFTPAISIEEGIRKTLLWYAENRTAEEA
jgi:UDP-glucuronate decarboxylase